VFVVAFITFFLLKDGNRMKKAIISQVPNRHFELALSLSYRISQQVSRYVRGQFVVAMIVGLLSIFALYLLHIRYYIFIGALAGLANMIPYFGPIVGAVPAIVVALIDTGSIQPVIGIAVAFATIQLIDNVLISPTVVSKSVDLHPLVVAVVVLAGGTLGGLAGMLFAVPIAGSVKVTIEEVQRYLKFRSRLQQSGAGA
ncbi:MAG: AI-2E family transporter, partial [Calditrichaeota bacterium]|nr:AI-2E family transporter [Calditrichota bacterium]